MDALKLFGSFGVNLFDYLAVYAIDHDVRDSTIAQYKFVVISFLKSYPGAKLSDLTREKVNSWLYKLQSSGLSPHTVKQRRMSMLTLWRAAFESGHTDSEPKRIRRIKTPDLCITALTDSQLSKLFSRIDGLERTMPNCQIRRRDYLRTFTKATLETSLRQSDLHQLEWAALKTTGGRVTIVQRKTSFRRPVVISRDTMNDLESIGYDGHFVWPAPKPDYLPRVYQSLGVTHTLLRKTAITRQEKARPGTGWIFAGHRSPDTTRRWYTDHDFAYEDILFSEGETKCD